MFNLVTFSLCTCIRQEIFITFAKTRLEYRNGVKLNATKIPLDGITNAFIVLINVVLDYVKHTAIKYLFYLFNF